MNVYECVHVTWNSKFKGESVTINVLQMRGKHVRMPRMGKVGDEDVAKLLEAK